MLWSTRKAALIVLLAALRSAAADPGPGHAAACAALAEQARQALVLKKSGLTVDKAVSVLTSQPAPDTVPPAQLDFYRKQLPGAARFAYMAGMSGDATAQYYLKQCRQGS